MQVAARCTPGQMDNSLRLQHHRIQQIYCNGMLMSCSCIPPFGPLSSAQIMLVTVSYSESWDTFDLPKASPQPCLTAWLPHITAYLPRLTAWLPRLTTFSVQLRTSACQRTTSGSTSADHAGARARGHACRTSSSSPTSLARVAASQNCLVLNLAAAC